MTTAENNRVTTSAGVRMKGFYVDQSICIGCRTCQIACKDKNDLVVGKNFRHVVSFETGSYPNATMYHLSIACNHCTHPACFSVCPTGALFIDKEDGTVQHDDDRCIGCKYCVMACPYGQPVFMEDLGIVHKCDACIELRANGEDPACVASCPMRAIEFGYIDDLREKHGDAVATLPILPDENVTNPSLAITPRAAALQDAYKKLLM